MILRLRHRLPYICSAVCHGAVRCFIYGLLAVPFSAFAQVGTDTLTTGKPAETVMESSASTNAEEATEGTKNEETKSPVVTFRPSEVWHQKRYRPTENDSLFTSTWWRRLYVGVGAGFQSLTDNVSSVSNSYVTGYVGYRFNPIHSLRLHASYTTFQYGQDNKQSARSVGFGVDYLASLTNFAWGYNRSRLIDVSSLIGVGTRINSRLLVNRIAPYAYLGAHADLHLSSIFSLYAEPYVGVQRRLSVLFGHSVREPWTLMYGVNVGLQMALDKRIDHFTEADSIYRHFFFDSSIGVVIPGSAGGILHRSGHGYQGAVGMWLNPMLGLRLGMQAQSFRWSSEMVQRYGASVRSSNNQALVSGRAEVIVNPLNFSKRWRDKEGGHDFDLNVLLGGDFGWNVKSNVPNTTNGAFRCYYYGFTGAVQALYRISRPGTYIFVEPRYLAAMYNVPYQNTQNSLFTAEHSLSLNIGTRIYMMHDGGSASGAGEFVPRWWAGLDVGGVKVQRAHSLTSGGLGQNPSVGLSVGYDWKRYASFRAQLVYQNLFDTHSSSYTGYDANGKKVRGSGLWDSSYSLMDLRLAYMLNLNNLFQGYNSNRRFNLWMTAGPALSFVAGQSDTWVEDQKGKLPSMDVMTLGDSRSGEVSPAVHASLMATLRLGQSPFELSVEAMGQYNFIHGLNPGNKGRLNNIKYGLSVGTRYYFEQNQLYDFFRGADSKPWQKGWELSASYGWALPMDTGMGLHGSGSSFAISAGYWFNRLLGARLGITGQQSYYRKQEVEAVVEPVSGVQVHAPYTLYNLQLMFGGRAELMLNPLNLLRSRRELEEAPTWDLNLSAGMSFGGMGKAGGMNCGYLGFTTSAAVLYRLTRVTQLYVEPRFDLISYGKYNDKLDYNESFADRNFTVSVGARITRPTEESDKSNGSIGENSSSEDNQLAHRGLWVAGGVGGSKMLQRIRVGAGGAGIQPSVGVSVGYDLNRLHSFRANLVYDLQSRLRPDQPYAVTASGMNRRYTGTVNTSVHQMDLQLLYMLNVTNLWTGYDKRNKFNIYLEAGPAFSTNLAQSNSLADGELAGGSNFRYLGTDYSGKCSFALASGILMALSVDKEKKWDITAELLGQFYFNRGYLPEFSPRHLNAIKMNFSVGTRYKF